ncbi:MAG: PadR family transcriptional regulator [Gemmatimonadetes bacterium]|nr:PadR family transcriptional regulator [Gemmatimonadota bacterium]
MFSDDRGLLQGTLDLLILRTLSWGPAHGYGIASWIEQVTEDALRVEEGSLYPALHRMERKGWVEPEWGVSENNRRAKFYRLTAEGRSQLAQKTRGWNRLMAVVGRALTSAERPSWASGTVVDGGAE